METRSTKSILTFVLRSSSAELHQRKRDLDAASKTDDEHMILAAICRSVKDNLPHAIDEIELSPNDEREEKLTDFLCDLSAARIEWIEEVKVTHWDKFDYKSKAAQIFMTAESLGISGTASFAILAASMALQGFKVPNDLNKMLWAAKRNSQQQLKELMDAEKRRETELKKHQ